TFIPNKDNTKSSLITFVQSGKLIDAKGKPVFFGTEKYRKAGDWAIDRIQNQKYGWYCIQNDGSVSAWHGAVGSSPFPLVDSTLMDKPRSSQVSTKWTFEAYAIAKDGDQAGTVYGGIRWGFEVDAAGKLKAIKNEFIATQTADFKASVTA